jgi:hypothetical protein
MVPTTDAATTEDTNNFDVFIWGLLVRVNDEPVGQRGQPTPA